MDVSIAMQVSPTKKNPIMDQTLQLLNEKGPYQMWYRPLAMNKKYNSGKEEIHFHLDLACGHSDAK